MEVLTILAEMVSKQIEQRPAHKEFYESWLNEIKKEISNETEVR